MTLIQAGQINTVYDWMNQSGETLTYELATTWASITVGEDETANCEVHTVRHERTKGKEFPPTIVCGTEKITVQNMQQVRQKCLRIHSDYLVGYLGF